MRRGQHVALSCSFSGYKLYLISLILDTSCDGTVDAKTTYNKVFDALEAHQDWFSNSIPLIASENVPSPAVREAIVSDFGNRYAE